MANNSNKSTTTTRRSTIARDWRKIMNLFAYIATVMIGVCLLLSKLGILSGIADALRVIALVIAYIIVAIGGWFYIANKKNVWLWVVYFVSLVLIIVSYIL